MPGREDALREYCRHGGVISLSKGGGLAYPSAEKLDAKISCTEGRIARVSLGLRSMGTCRDAGDPDDPLLIEHSFKKTVDEGYRADARAAALPGRMLEDERGRKVLDAFLHLSGDSFGERGGKSCSWKRRGSPCFCAAQAVGCRR